MQIICTYKIINQDNGRYYYGSTKNFNQRKKIHMTNLRHNKHHCIYLQRAFTINSNSFIIEIDRIFDTIENARNYEQKFLDENYDNLYNTSKYSSGGDLVSCNENREYIIAKLKESLKIRYENMTPEERKSKYGKQGEKNVMYGKTHTDEVRKKLSEINKNNKNALGRKASEETKQKLSEIASKRLGEKNPFFGKHHTEKTKKILSEARKGKLPRNTRKVIYGNRIYESVSSCARENNISSSLVIYYIKKNKASYYQEGAETSRKA